MAQSYKILKEQFVSGLNGGSVSEINIITAVAPLSYMLWGVLQSYHGFFTTFGPLQFFLDFLLNVEAILLVTTVYSGIPSIFNVILLSAAATAYLLGRQSKSPARHMQRQDATADADALAVLPVRPFITAYRGSMMVITCVAILAVDFHVFPRRFAKVETWGTSLMDIGVGSFVFAAGLVSARPIIIARAKGKQSALVPQLRASVSTALPLIVLGLARLYSVKKVDYAEHVTEYGVHWNFFFTLALLPPFVALCEPLPDTVRCYILPFVAMSVYQIVLDHTRLKAFILVGPRDTLLSANREGVFSFWGYLAIFLAAQGVGLSILPRKTDGEGKFILGKSNRSRLIQQLVLLTSCWSSLYFLSTNFHYGLRIQTSRRLANAPYVEWVMAFNCGQLLLYLLVEALVFPDVYNPSTKSQEEAAVSRATSKVLQSFNRNGLAIFLAANLLTGLVNLTLDTLNTKALGSVAVLNGYILLVTGLAVVLDIYKLSIKL